jgi:site-specific DNA recombinase
MKHVAIYLRRSRDEEGKGIEILLEGHEKTLKELCKKHNCSYEIFKEIASSTTIQNRPEMVKLLERIKQYHFDAVAVMDIDRLSRNEYDSNDIKRILFETGTLIITPTRTYDLQSDDDSLLVGVSSLIASQEYKMIHKRMRRGKRHLQTLGIWTNGTPPFGYTKDSKTKKLKPNENAETIKFIFESIIDNKTIPEIVTNLNMMGIRTRSGYSFRYNSILRILNNECYKGTIISNRIKGKHNDFKPMSDWVIVENAHTAIVSEKMWNKVNKIVNKPSFKSPRAKNKIYPTSNLIFCANCGKLQGCNTRQDGRIYIKHCPCGNRIARYEKVLERIKEDIIMTCGEHLHTLLASQIDFGLDNADEERERHLKAIQKIEKALTNIDVLFEEGEIDLPTYRQRKIARQNELAGIKQKLESFESNTDKINTIKLKLKLFETVKDEWHLWSDERINKALHTLISGILWKRDNHGRASVSIIYKTYDH